MSLSAEQQQLIFALACGELSDDDVLRARSLLSMNSEAQRLLHFTEAIRDLLATDDSVSPSEQSLRGAKSLFAKYKSTVPSSNPWQSWIDGLGRLIAQLVFDSRTPEAMVGFRSGASAATRLTFEIDDIEIDLELASAESQASTSSVRVIGQVSRESEGEPTHVAFAQRGTLNIIAETTSDNTGMFEITIPNSAHDLLIRTKQGIVVAENIRLT